MLPTEAEKQTAIDTICFECAELPLIYSEPGLFKHLIGMWSLQNFYTWKTLWNTTTLDYNPIENFDRFEEYTDMRTSKASSSGSSSGNSSTQVRGFDGGNVVDKDNMKETGTTSNTGNSEDNFKHTAHMHGTIGVTTSQAMIIQEREIAAFSFYKYLAADFKRQFCCMVY